MPSYKFLFDTRKIAGQQDADALQLPGGEAPPPGYEIVPTTAARELVAYLTTLDHSHPLAEAGANLPPPKTSGTGRRCKMNQNPDDLRTAGLHRGPNHIDYRETADLTSVHSAVQREHSVGTPGRGADAFLADGAVRGGDFLGRHEFQRRFRRVLFQRG